MINIPENPRVVIRVNGKGNVASVASNIAPDLTVELVREPADYQDLAANCPFDTTRPVQPVQVLAAKKNS
jgi:hypothetical protein